MNAGGERLEDVAARLDAERFVGRGPALALATAAMDGTSARRVLLVHGPAGVGKSGLLRAIGRQAAEQGAQIDRVDGRLVSGDPGALADAVHGRSAGPEANGADIRADGRRVLLVDEVDELASLQAELRSLIGAFDASVTVVIAGRQTPDRAWFDGGFEHITQEIRLSPLDMVASRELLRRLGADDPSAVEVILGWAGGFPLALTVAATSHASGTEGAASFDLPGPDAQTLDDQILARLAGRELDGLDPDVLDVAGVAPLVDARLLADVLPSRPTRTGLAQLRATSVAEAVGNRLALHRLVRSAVKARLRQTDPERYRTLVVRVADHLRNRALTGSPRAILELIDLIEDPLTRSGFGPSATHFADRIRPGDVATVGDALGTSERAWWGRFQRWCTEAPEHVIVVRSVGGAISAVAIAFSPGRMPPWAVDHIEAGPVVEHLRSAGIDACTSIIHDVHSLHDPADVAGAAEVQRVGNTAAFAACGLPNPRYVYLTATHEWAEQDANVWGATEVEALRRHDEERHLVTTVVDFGPAGIVGGLHAIIRAEQLGPAAEQPPSARGAALIATLRAFHDDEALAEEAPGPGSGAERVAVARQELRDAIDAAFGDSEPERRLRTALERTYLDPDGGHAVARQELFMSRSSFYRHLQRARDRLMAVDDL